MATKQAKHIGKDTMVSPMVNAANRSIAGSGMRNVFPKNSLLQKCNVSAPIQRELSQSNS